MDREAKAGETKNETSDKVAKNKAILVSVVTREKWGDSLIMFPTIYEKERCVVK